MKRMSRSKSGNRGLGLKCSKKSRRGAVAVEFAITASVFLLLFFGAYEYARATSIRQSVELALYEGARQGIVAGATRQEVIAEMERILNISGIRFADVEASSLNETTPNLTVRIVVDYERELSSLAWFFQGKRIDRSLTAEREGAR